MALYDRGVTMLLGVLGQGATSAQLQGPAIVDAVHCRIKDTGDGSIYEYWEAGEGANAVGRIQRIGSGALSAALPLWPWKPDGFVGG